MLFPAFGNLHQIAWVVQNLDDGIDLLRKRYNIPSFFVTEHKSDVLLTDGRCKTIELRYALANVNAVQLELIEATGGSFASFYSSEIPAHGGPGFHHICEKITGTLADWDAHVSGLEKAGRDIYFHLDVGEGARVLFTDERDTIGFYVEHVWFSPEVDNWMKETVPSYGSRLAGN